MDSFTFILAGENREVLSPVKQVLCNGGHTFLGYLREKNTILRNVRIHQPDFLIVDLDGDFGPMREMMEIIDDDMLTACILYTPLRTNELIGFLKRARSTAILLRPCTDDAILQVSENAVFQHRRMLNLDSHIRSLNEKLEARQLVEKAKWLLVAREGISECEAYEQIKKRSRDKRVPMKEVAEAILMAFGN